MAIKPMHLRWLLLWSTLLSSVQAPKKSKEIKKRKHCKLEFPGDVHTVLTWTNSTHNKINAIYVLHISVLMVHLISFSASVTSHLTAHYSSRPQSDSYQCILPEWLPLKTNNVIRVRLAEAFGRQKQFCRCVHTCVCVRTIIVSELTA